VELGVPDLAPDLENGLLGAVAGQERTIEVEMPAEDEKPESAPRKVRYVVNIRKIQEKKLRPLDDNLAREVFQLESLEELRSRVRLRLEGEERLRTRRQLESAISQELIQYNPVDLPERLVAWMLDRVIHEATEGRTVSEALHKELEQRFRPDVERSLRREVLLESVAREEKLEVSDEEVAAEIQRMAQADPRQAAKIRARYLSEERRKALRESLLERKALDWVIDAADLEDVHEEAAGQTPLVVPAAR
jgi:trigger factor